MDKEKPYKDEHGNLVVPINTQDSKYILGRVEQFRDHGKRAQQGHMDIARSARNKNLEKGGNRGTAHKQ